MVSLLSHAVRNARTAVDVLQSTPGVSYMSKDQANQWVEAAQQDW